MSGQAGRSGLLPVAVSGDWTALHADAMAVRMEVFVREQGIPAELEWDEDDARSLHVVLRDGQGLAVATGRLLPAHDGVAKIGRMAVLSAWRGKGLGAQVMRALSAAAWQRGDRELVLHAQAAAVGFYRRLGFESRGDPFDEVGMPHQQMFKTAPGR